MAETEDTTSNTSKNWLGKIVSILTREPKNRQELLELMEDAAERNLIDDEILYMLEGVLRVQELRVRDIMIPRMHMSIITIDMPWKEIISTVVNSGHSRFPVVRENKDEVLGILLAKDLLAYNTHESIEQFNIHNILRPAVFIPENKQLNNLLQDFQGKRNHMAVVVDEYGGVTGLITIEDVLEQIVGSIEDEYDIDNEPTIKQNKDNTYTIKAITTIEEFNRFFDVNLEGKGSETIGGLITRYIEHLPKRGEIIQIGKFEFKVLKADNRRIYLVQANLLHQTTQQ